MNPLRVVCFSPYPHAGPSVRHRVCGYRQAWQAAGIDLTLWPFMNDRLYQIRRDFGITVTLEKLLRVGLAFAVLAWRCTQVRQFDLVIIHREASPLGWTGFERWILRAKRPVVFDVDDATWQPPSNPVNQRALFWREGRVAEVMVRCTHVVTGNDFLARYAHAVNPATSVIPTTYPDSIRTSTGSQPPVVVWIGNLGNAHYLHAVLPALERAARRAPFILRLVGGADIFEITSDSLEIEYQPWSEAQEIALIASADIGIMPLPDRPYEQGKCAFKLIQYFSLGLVVIASPVGMNASLVRDGENGLLATAPTEWESALVRLLTEPALRRRCAHEGRRTYLESFTREAGAARWIALIRALGSRGAPA
jgi:glycosyltransferase involved in cell wall biosynthesis